MILAAAAQLAGQAMRRCGECRLDLATDHGRGGETKLSCAIASSIERTAGRGSYSIIASFAAARA